MTQVAEGRRRWPELVAANVDEVTRRELLALARAEGATVAQVVRRSIRRELERARSEKEAGP